MPVRGWTLVGLRRSLAAIQVPPSQSFCRRYGSSLPTSLTYIWLWLVATNHEDLLRIRYGFVWSLRPPWHEAQSDAIHADLKKLMRSPARARKNLPEYAVVGTGPNVCYHGLSCRNERLQAVAEVREVALSHLPQTGRSTPAQRCICFVYVERLLPTLVSQRMHWDPVTKHTITRVDRNPSSHSEISNYHPQHPPTPHQSGNYHPVSLSDNER